MSTSDSWLGLGKGLVALGVAPEVLRWAIAPSRFEVKAPEGAPNVLLVLVDDLGFAGTSKFGGPVGTPTFEQIANEGVYCNNYGRLASRHHLAFHRKWVSSGDNGEDLLGSTDPSSVADLNAIVETARKLRSRIAARDRIITPPASNNRGRQPPCL